MAKMINLNGEALELVNELCSPSHLEETITTLESAEDSLQKQAYNYDDEALGLYTVAYQLKLFKNKLVSLKSLMEDGRDEG